MVGSSRMPMALAAPAVAFGVMLSGCMSSPTYGTDKTATAQLTNDVAGMFSIAPRANPVAEYKPRPELVKPASLAELPQPQESVVAANPAWPESPEQRRARIRADATANQNNPLYEPLIVNDLARGTPPPNDGLSPSARLDRESAPLTNVQMRDSGREAARRRAANNQGSPTSRKYLSEPPLVYRQPSDTAATGDLGEDEEEKERRLQREARGGGSWRDWIPGL